MVELSAEPPAVRLELIFDRLLPIKLQQVYGLLVSNCVRPVGQVSEENRGGGREACRDIRKGLIGQTEGSTYNCQSNRGSTHVRRAAGLQRPRRLGD